ncbi:MAG: hypothetical protein PHN80_12105 [Hespellia sp.]|nr:hypothetical protein [Hespellia sp.]
MDEHTIRLLKECDSGCKMAIESIDRIQDYVENAELQKVIMEYKKRHEELEARSTRLLQNNGESEKHPSPVAAAMSRLTTEMKMMMRDDSTQIAKILMNGCNMGIQSIGEYRHKYNDAQEVARSLAGELVKVEEKFLRDLEKFL